MKLGAVLALVLVMTACRGRTGSAPAVHGESASTRVRVVKPKTEDLAVASTLIGTLRPWQRSVLATRLAGDVVSLSVEPGDRVTTGQRLGSLRVPGLPEELASAIANEQVAQASLAEEKDVADRTKRVSEANAAAVSSAEVEMTAAKASSASAKLKSVQANRGRVEALVGDALIQAPFDGVVITRFVDSGSSVAAGTRLVEIAQIAKLRLVVDVPERETGLVKPGARVSVTVPALSGKRIEAKVSRFAPALDPMTRVLRVEIDIDNDGSIAAGLEARVRFADGTLKGALTLPAEALVVRGDAMSVFVARDDHAVNVPIQVGYDDGAKFAVEKGIDGAEEVIVGGGGLLQDGDPIEVAR